MTETNSASDPQSPHVLFGVEVENFESALDDGMVGGGVAVEPGQMLVTDDGQEVPYLVDTSPRVADVLGQGIDAPPFGEEV